MTLRARLLSSSFEVDRLARILTIVREEVAFRTFTDQDWLELAGLLFERTTRYRHGSEHNESGLFAFERAAIELAFPKPPAAILVGACGGGREILGLLERGYRIAAAYDPVDSFIESLRADPRLREIKDRISVGSHQRIESLPFLTQPSADGSAIDAVIVGWGSYTYLRGSPLRVEFLGKLRRLCPRGPVLLSVFAEMGSEPERPARLRARLRRLLGTTPQMAEPGDALNLGQGRVHYFTEAGFRAEAAEAGYRVDHWQEHDFGAAHAILFPQVRAEAG